MVGQKDIDDLTDYSDYGILKSSLRIWTLKSFQVDREMVVLGEQTLPYLQQFETLRTRNPIICICNEQSQKVRWFGLGQP